MSQIVDGQPDGKRERQRKRRKQPCGEEFAEHGRPNRNGQREKQLDGTGATLIGSKPHRDRRYQKEIEPSVVTKEDRKVGNPIVVEASDIEGERAHREQKNDDENESQRRGEVGSEFTPKYGSNVSQACLAGAASCVVMARKTSSR